MLLNAQLFSVSLLAISPLFRRSRRWFRVRAVHTYIHISLLNAHVIHYLKSAIISCTSAVSADLWRDVSPQYIETHGAAGTIYIFMRLDRVETGGEDRPNEVVVFLENRARVAVALGSLSPSYIYPPLFPTSSSPHRSRSSPPSSFTPSLGVFSSGRRLLPPCARHLVPATLSTSSISSTALRSLV